MTETHETRETGFRPIGWWLKEADARLEAAFDLRLRGLGVSSRRAWQVLASVARAPVRRTTLVSELALFDPPEVSDRLVDDLLDEGWLAEETGMLRLTAEGEDLHARLVAAVGEIRGWVAEVLPGEDYQTLVDLLRRLVQALPPVPEP